MSVERENVKKKKKFKKFSEKKIQKTLRKGQIKQGGWFLLKNFTFFMYSSRGLKYCRVRTLFWEDVDIEEKKFKTNFYYYFWTIFNPFQSNLPHVFRFIFHWGY